MSVITLEADTAENFSDKLIQGARNIGLRVMNNVFTDNSLGKSISKNIIVMPVIISQTVFLNAEKRDELMDRIYSGLQVRAVKHINLFFSQLERVSTIHDQTDIDEFVKNSNVFNFMNEEQQIEMIKTIEEDAEYLQNIPDWAAIEEGHRRIGNFIKSLYDNGMLQSYVNESLKSDGAVMKVDYECKNEFNQAFKDTLKSNPEIVYEYAEYISANKYLEPTFNAVMEAPVNVSSGKFGGTPSNTGGKSMPSGLSAHSAGVNISGGMTGPLKAGLQANRQANNISNGGFTFHASKNGNNKYSVTSPNGSVNNLGSKGHQAASANQQPNPQQPNQPKNKQQNQKQQKNDNKKYRDIDPNSKSLKPEILDDDDEGYKGNDVSLDIKEYKGLEKINSGAPIILDFKVNVASKDSKNRDIPFTVGIKPILHVVTAKEMIDTLEEAVINNKILFRTVSFLKGEVSFLNLILGFDRKNPRLNSILYKYLVSKGRAGSSGSATKFDPTKGVRKSITQIHNNSYFASSARVKSQEVEAKFAREVGNMSLTSTFGYNRILTLVIDRDDVNQMINNDRYSKSPLNLNTYPKIMKFIDLVGIKSLVIIDQGKTEVVVADHGLKVEVMSIKAFGSKNKDEKTVEDLLSRALKY